VVGGGGSPNCGNNDSFPAARGGRDAKGGNRGVARGPVEGEKGVGDAATVAPFKGRGSAAWKGAGAI
jgi:hypothetical protein